MNGLGLLPAARFTKTLDIVWREGQHLAYNRVREFAVQHLGMAGTDLPPGLDFPT